MEKLLIEQNRLREQKKLQEDSLALKDKELQILQRMLPAQPKVKEIEDQPLQHYSRAMTALNRYTSMKGN